MAIHRRRLLQYTGAGCVLAALQPTLSDAATTLRVLEVRDSAALPLFAPGDLLLADTTVTHFVGDGLYLYPSWGQPRPYQIRAVGQRLEFRNPGSGTLLWTQSAGLATEFAGRVVEQSEALAYLSYPALNVPVLPLPVFFPQP